MPTDVELNIPGTDDVLRPGYKVKLGRFKTEVWTVGFGWYSASGNRPCCGWYLTSEDSHVTKPLQSIDLVDIYVLQICYVQGDPSHRSIEAIDQEVIDMRKGVDGTLYDTAGNSLRTQIQDTRDEIPDMDDISSIQGVIEGSK